MKTRRKIVQECRMRRLDHEPRHSRAHGKPRYAHACERCDREPVWSIHGPESLHYRCLVQRLDPGTWIKHWLARRGITMGPLSYLLIRLGLKQQQLAPQTCSGCSRRAELINTLWFDLRRGVRKLVSSRRSAEPPS